MSDEGHLRPRTKSDNIDKGKEVRNSVSDPVHTIPGKVGCKLGVEVETGYKMC